MTKKNIAIIFLGDFFFDARCINMARSLLLENYSVTIICTYKNIINYEEFKNIEFYNVALHKKGIFKYIEFHNRVAQFLKNKVFDTIIAGDLYSLSSACLDKNINIIYDCREIYTDLAVHNTRPLYNQILYRYEKYFLKSVNTILTTAATDEKLLKQKYAKFKHLYWKRIYNYPINSFEYKKGDFKKKFNIPANHITIIYQGVIQKHRGIGQLIKLITHDSNITSIIVGDGEDRAYYIKKAKQLGVVNRVKFINKTPYLELFGYTAECDIGWLVIRGKGVSNQFAMPNKLFEYTLMGLPVISSPLQNIQQVVKKYNLGIIVRENSIDEQLNAIQYIKNNKNQYNHIKKTVREKFTWDIQHEKFINLINEK